MLQLPALPTRCAVEILNAWQDRNMEQLNAGLARAATLASARWENPHEFERAELLGSVASEMQAMIASGHVEDTGVYFNLLEHLAHSRVPRRFRTVRADGAERDLRGYQDSLERWVGGCAGTGNRSPHRNPLGTALLWAQRRAAAGLSHGPDYLISETGRRGRRPRTRGSAPQNREFDPVSADETDRGLAQCGVRIAGV